MDIKIIQIFSNTKNVFRKRVNCDKKVIIVE